MRNFKSDTQFTSTLHLMMKHRIQAAVWDLLSWLDGDSTVDSMRDLLLFIRLVADYGDPNQGKLFFERIQDNKHLKSIHTDIAERFIQRGDATGQSWLKDLGGRIITLQEAGKAPAESSANA